MIKKSLIKSLFFLVLASVSIGATTDEEVPNTIITKNPKREVNTIKAPKNRESAKMSLKINKVPIEEIETSTVIKNKGQLVYKIKKDDKDKNRIKERSGSNSKEKIVVAEDMDTLNKLVDKKITLETLKELVVNEVLEKGAYKEIKVNSFQPVYIGVFKDDILTKVYNGKLKDTRRGMRISEADRKTLVLYEKPIFYPGGNDHYIAQKIKLITGYPIVTKRISFKDKNHSENFYTTFGRDGISPDYGDPLTGVDEDTTVEINFSNTMELKNIVQPAKATSGESGGMNGRKRNFTPAFTMSYDEVKNGRKVTVELNKASVKVWFTGQVDWADYGEVFNDMQINFELTPKSPYNFNDTIYFGEIQITTTLENTDSRKKVVWGEDNSPVGFSDPRPGPWFDVSYQLFGSLSLPEQDAKVNYTYIEYANLLMSEGKDVKVSSYDINIEGVYDLLTVATPENNRIKLTNISNDVKESGYIYSVGQGENPNPFPYRQFYFFDDTFGLKLRLSRLPGDKARIESFVTKTGPSKPIDYSLANLAFNTIDITLRGLVNGIYAFTQNLIVKTEEGVNISNAYGYMRDTGFYEQLTSSPLPGDKATVELIKLPLSTGTKSFSENIGYKLPSYMIDRYYGLRTSLVSRYTLMKARHSEINVDRLLNSLNYDYTKALAETKKQGNLSISNSTLVDVPSFVDVPELKENRGSWIVTTDIVNGTRKIDINVDKIPKLEVTQNKYETRVKMISPYIIPDIWDGETVLTQSIGHAFESTLYDIYEEKFKLPVFDDMQPEFHPKLEEVILSENQDYTVILQQDMYGMAGGTSGVSEVIYSITINEQKLPDVVYRYVGGSMPPVQQIPEVGEVKIGWAETYGLSNKLIDKGVKMTFKAPKKDINYRVEKKYNKGISSTLASIVDIDKQVLTTTASVEGRIKVTNNPIGIETIFRDRINIGTLKPGEERGFLSPKITVMLNKDVSENITGNIAATAELLLEGKTLEEATENEKIKLEDIKLEKLYRSSIAFDNSRKFVYMEISGKAVAPSEAAPGRYNGELTVEITVNPLQEYNNEETTQKKK